MNKLVLPALCVAVVALFCFDLWRGFTTGKMRFRLGDGLKAEADRASDERGFWIYTAFNVAGIGLAALALYSAFAKYIIARTLDVDRHGM